MVVKVSKACADRGDAILERAAHGATVVEVGTLIGQLAWYCMTNRPDLKWIMVDSWLPMGEQPDHYKATGDDHALHDATRALAHRQAAYRVAGEIGASVLHMPSVAASALVMAADVVFIDADHSYEGCKADIAAWRHVARDWLGGHDYRNPDPRFGGVDRAVDEAFPDAVEGGNFTWWVRP